ncbi:VOC family protein [Octadecabacter sp. SW4]|uniref:VOC family protein n=1 Tax=Octadecabacter sp. SW4 TaxID=2602067 RepID=UPI0011C1E6E1|nr:VOC family protein [Octadecabacter sp. SW4]QEE35067.1 VOC family protein [Octadecabacter sp. SW4]
MAATSGMNHLGLTVADLDASTAFFAQALGWEVLARDDTYPRTTVSDGAMRLTLWQAHPEPEIVAFARRTNVGLHHLAMTVESEARLNDLAQTLRDYPGVTIEFMPELVGQGPRRHMIFTDPGGLRLELIWDGAD